MFYAQHRSEDANLWYFVPTLCILVGYIDETSRRNIHVRVMTGVPEIEPRRPRDRGVPEIEQRRTKNTEPSDLQSSV